MRGRGFLVMAATWLLVVSGGVCLQAQDEGLRNAVSEQEIKQGTSYLRLTTGVLSGDPAAAVAAVGLVAGEYAFKPRKSAGAQDDRGLRSAPKRESAKSRKAREELLQAYGDVFGPDDLLLEAFLHEEGGDGTIVIKDFWRTTEDFDSLGLKHPRSEIDLSVLRKRGMGWGVLVLRKHLLTALRWDTSRTQKYYFSVVGVRDEYELSQIISKIRLSAIQELMTEIEAGIHQAGDGAEVIISFTEVGDLVVTIKDVSNPETPVITKVFTAGAGMTPILPGKFGKWVGDKVDRGVKWVWKKVSGVWKRAPKKAPTTLSEVNLKGTIQGFGKNLSEEGRFFGWRPGSIARQASDFTKDELLKRGWTKERLEQVAEAYEHIARITPSNPSAAGRAAQLREILQDLF